MLIIEDRFFLPFLNAYDKAHSKRSSSQIFLDIRREICYKLISDCQDQENAHRIWTLGGHEIYVLWANQSEQGG
jgi:hypothetical protein